MKKQKLSIFVKFSIFTSLIFLFAIKSQAQSISIFDIDTSAFPIMKAKFFAFDKDGEVQRPNSSELKISENGINRTITNVSCPNPKPLQTVSLAMSIDISGSMSGSDYGEVPVELGKLTATELCKFVVMPPSEFALQTCHATSTLIQDFTTSRSKILKVIPPIKAGGDNDFVEHLLNKLTGLLNIAKMGKEKRVAVLYTDAWWYALAPKELKACLDTCNKYNIEFYTVIYSRKEAEPNGIKSSLRELCSKSGGFFYDGVTSTEVAKSIANNIQKITQGAEPCEISWESDVSCISSSTNVELSWQGQKSSFEYITPSSSIAELIVSSNYIAFGKKQPFSKNDTTIILTAKNAEFNITGINRKFGSVDFALVNTSLPINIPKNTSVNITIRFSPSDSNIKYSSFEIETDKCNAYFSANGGFPLKKSTLSTLKLTHPNGGESFVVGSDTLITWTGISPTDNVSLEYSIDNGTSWNLISKQATGLKYKWNPVPKPTSQLCLVKIRQLVGGINNSNDTVHTLLGHTNDVSCVTYSPDGSKITSAGMDNSIKIWNANTGDLIRTITGVSESFYSVAFSPDGSNIASGSTFGGILFGIKIWNANTGELIRTLMGHNGGVGSVAYSPDGSRIVSGSFDSTIKIWNANTGALIRTLMGHNGEVSSVSYSPDGSNIASGSYDKSIKIWNANTGALIHTLTGHNGEVFSVNYKPDGSNIVSGGDDYIDNNRIKIWNANTGVLVGSMMEQKENIISVAYSPDGSNIVSGSYDNSIKIWNANTGNMIRTLIGHNGDVLRVAYSPDGSSIVSGSRDYKIKIWNLDVSTLQEDVSDAIFAIVAPSPQSQNIDMKKCLVGTSRDTLVSTFIQNKGSYPFRVDSIVIKGRDANQFMIVSGIPPFAVPVSDTRAVEFRFKPNSVGFKTAQLVIYTQTDTLFQNIQGEGIAPTISIVNNLIDFKQVGIGKNKDTINVLTIKNIGITDIAINSVTHSGPNSIDFSTILGNGPFTLAPGEIAKMNLRFSPKEIGRTSGSLLFNYNSFGSPTVVQLFGEGIQNFATIRSSNLTIPNFTCKTLKDTIIEIKNEGLDTLKLKSYKIQGTNPNEFRLNQDISNLIVLPDSVLKVPVSFNPFSSGNKSAELIIESNAIPDSVYVLKLQAFQDSVNIAPNIKQIDLGTLCPNTSKDTLISLENYGTLETGFDIVYDKDLSSTNNKTTLLTNEKYALAIKFDGLANEGTFSRKVKILDKICGKEEIVDLVGTIEGTNIQTAIEILKSKLGQTDQKELTIYNKSNHPINIASEPNIAPFTFASSYFPITINKNDSVKLQVSYLFVDKLEKKVNVSFSAEPCNVNTNFELKVQYASNPKAQLFTGTYQAYPGDVINIPIMLKDVEDLESSNSKNLTVDLTFNATLLEPIGDTPIGNLSSDNKFRTITLVLPTKADEHGVLRTFKFKVGLGNDSTTSLFLSNQSSDAGDVDLQVASGEFHLLGICRAAGPRLINPNGEVKLSLIRPNPVGDNGELDIETIENGQTELYIVNLKGEKVATLYQGELAAGKQTLIISTKDLSNGTYFVILQTPTVTQKVKMEVVK